MTHRSPALTAHRIAICAMLWLVAMTYGGGSAVAQSLTITSGPNFGTVPIGEVQIALTATGGVGGYTWNLVSGTLPTGLAIRTDVPSFFPAGTTAGLIGVATTPGTYNFTISVTSGASTVNSACTLKVTSLTPKDQFTLPNGFVGLPYNYTLTALNPAGAVTWTANTALPPGLTFTNGVISGIPTSAGSTTVNYTLSDGTSTIGHSFQITVSAVRFVTAGVLTNVTQGSTYNASVVASGGTGSFSYAMVSGGLPAGLSLSQAGTISGTVSNNAGPGRYGFGVIATDSNNVSYTKTFSIDVIGVPVTLPAVQLGNLAYRAATIGFGYSRLVTVNNGGTAPFTWSATGLPPGLDIRTYDVSSRADMTPDDAEVWGTPTSAGDFPVQIAVTDANGVKATAAFTFSVSVLGIDGNDNPPNGTIGTLYSKQLRVLGGTAPYTVTQTNLPNAPLPNGLALNSSTLLLNGTPLENGSFFPILEFTDSALHVADQPVGITISGGTSNININQGFNLGTATQNTNYTAQLSACCTVEQSFTWSVIGGSLPPGITLSSGGLLSGSGSTAGTYVFMVQATNNFNGASFARREFQLIVTPLNTTSCCLLPFGNVGSFYSQNLASLITGAAGSVTVTLAPGSYVPAGLTLTGGVLSGTPTATGQVNISLVFTDSGGHTLFRTYTVSIFAAGQLPPPGPNFNTNMGTFPIGEMQFALNATGGNGIYSWSFVSGSLPPGLALRTDVPSFFPAGTTAGLIGVATTPGTYTFSLSVTSNGVTTTPTFTMKITALTVKDLFNLPDATLGTPLSYTFTPLNNAGAVTFTLTGAIAPGLTLSSSGVLSGTPTTPGFYNVPYSINDGTDTVFRSFGLNVPVVQITTPGLLPNGTRGGGYNTTILATGGTQPYTFTSGGLPTGLSLNSLTGVLSGTVSSGQGRWDVSVTVTDHVGNSYTKNMAIDVLNPPVTTGYLQPYGNLDDCTIGSGCSQGIAVWNGGTAPFSWNVTGLPSGMSFRTGSGVTSNNIWPGDVELWGTPTAVGTFNVTVTVTDVNGLTTTETYPLHVSNLMVDGNDRLPNGTRGTAYSKTLRVIGGTGPYTVAQQPASQMPSGLGLSGFVVSGTPAENGFFNGEFLFTDSASPTHDTLQITSYFNINPTSNVNINNGPNLGSIILNSFYSNQLSACCVASYTWSLAGGTLPTGITITAAGLLSGTPTVAGVYTFTVQAADASNPSNFGLRVFTLNVTPLNYSSCCTLPFGNVGSLYSQTLPLTGATGSATFALAPSNFLPPGLSLNASTGLLSGTPTQVGQFNFQIIATDSAGHSITRNFTLFVFAAGGAPPVVITSNPNIVWAAGAREFGLNATGGNGIFTWSVVTGSLPPGISIRPDFAGFINPSTPGDLAGVATTPGTYNVTLMATSAGQSATQAFTIKVTALTAKDPNVPDGYVGVPYSYTFTALNNAGPVTWTATGVPNGMTLSSAGVLSGTPTASGVSVINLTLNDGTDTVGALFNYNLNIFDIRVTSPNPLPNATQFQSYTTTLAASGGTQPYTFSVTGLPSGLTLDPNTGIISGTPTNVGKFNFNVTVVDAHNVSRTSQEAIVTIGAPARLPNVSVGEIDDCTVYTPCTRNFGTFNGGTPPYSWSATGLPPGMSIRTGYGVVTSFVNGSDAEIWGVPTALGTYTITATVTDAAGASASLTFPLVISQLYAWGTPDSLVNGTRGTAYSSKMRIIGGSGTGYTANQVNGVLPQGLSRTGLVVSGTPTENGSFNPTFVFTDSLGHTYARTEGFFIGGGTSTVSVNNNFLSLGTVNQGIFFSFNLSESGAPSANWTLIGGTLPPGSNLTQGGVLSGTPTTAGTYIFTVQATDAANSANFGVRQLEIIVTPLNLSVSTGLPNGNVGTLYSQTLTVTGATGTVTWTLAPFNYLPPGLSLSSGGVLSGTPTAAGQFNFTIIATDAASSALPRTFNVSIYPAGTTPPLGLNFGPFITTTLGQQSFQLTAFGGTPPYHFSQAPGSTPITGMRVIDGPPLPTFFPPTVTGGWVGIFTTTGVFNTTLRVTDSLGATFDRPITVTVYNTAPQAPNPLPRGSVGTPYSYSFNGLGGSGSYSWGISNTPPGLSMSSAGVLSGTPSTAGTFFPSVIITDLSNNASIFWGYTLFIDNFAITTGGVLPEGTIGTPYSQTLAAPNCGNNCTWTIVSGSLPGGLSLNGSTGTISGTPTSFFNGGVTIQASGSNGTAQKMFGILVPPNTIQPLFINNGPTIGPNTQLQTTVFFLSAQGGTPPYTWSLASGTLPPGIRIITSPELIGFNLTPGETYLQGRPLQNGTFSFTMQVKDAVNTVATKAFTWQISEVIMSFTGLPIAGNPMVYNQPYSQGLLALGGTPPYTWAVAAGAFLPPGLSLNSSTGAISGTPANTGSNNTLITLSDSAGHSATQNVNFNSTSGTPATINMTGPDLGTIQQAFQTNFNLFPSGGTAPYTFTALTSLPPGCGLEQGSSILSNINATNALICTPFNSGTFTFTLRVDDSAGNFGVRTLTLRVAPFNLFNNTALPNGSVGVAYSQPLITFDNSGTVAFSIPAGSALPPGLSVVGSSIAGTPTAPGNYSFTLSGTDASGLVVNYGFSVTISPIAIGGTDIVPQIAIYNTPYTFTFTATGGGAVKTWSAIGLPNGLTMGSTTGTVSGTPTNVGTFRVTVTVTDGTSSVTRVFTLFSRFGDPGVLSLSLFSGQLGDVRLGQSFSLQLTPSGGVPPYTWTVAAGSTLPPGLGLSTNTSVANGQNFGLTYLEGAPNAANNYTFDLICTDSTGAQVRRTFTMNVTPMDILGGSLKSATIGTPYSEQLTVTGATGAVTFTYAASNTSFEPLPPGITLSPTGLFSGTPTSTGNFSLRVTASDSVGHTFSSFYTLSVLNSFGLLVTGGGPSSFTVGLGLFATLTTNGSSTYTWSIVSGALPPGMTLAPNGALNGAPSTAGVFTVTIRATDNANSSNFADRFFTVHVAPMQPIVHSVTQLPAGRVGTAYSYTLQMAGGTLPYTFTPLAAFVSPLPAGLTLSSSGVLSGTPTQSGSYSITYKVTDSAGLIGYFTTPTLNILGPGAINPLQGTRSSAHDGSVGTAYQQALDGFVIGGVPPYTWTLTPGSSLPPGIVILPGANGVSSYLGGIPTTAGAYSYFLNITDAAGQTATTEIFQNISPISVSPELPMFGFVGAAYTTTTLVPSGGTGPYSFALANGTSFPPGLSLSSAGVISGTPTAAGVFIVNVTVSDSASNVFTWSRTIDINNPSNQAPAIDLTQKTVLQLNNSLIPPFNVSFDTGSGLAFNANLAGTPGLVLQNTSGFIPAGLTMNLNTSGVPNGIYAGVLAAEVPNAAFTRLAIPVVFTVSTPPPCTYSLSISGYIALQTGQNNGGFTVNTFSNCSWTATSNAPWITVTSGSGTGSGTVSYKVAANPLTTQRVGTITAAGQTFTVTQFGSTVTCSYYVSPSTITTTAAAGQVYVSITASTNGCPWTASGLNASPSSGPGPYGSTYLTIPANNTNSPVTYHATVAGQDVTVVQSAANCVAGLNSLSTSLPAAGGSGSLNVTIPSGCSYSTVNGPGWIKVLSGASGNGPGPNPLNYTVDPNSSTTPRSASFSVGGTVFQVSQAGLPCSVNVDPSALGSPYSSTGGGGTISIVAGPTCSWNASSPVPWATVSPTSGMGNGTINVTVTSNAASATSRSANLTVNGQQVGITESGTICTYTLASSMASAPFGGGSGGVTVTAPAACGWNAQLDPSAPWLTITSSGSSGTADVLFSAAANPGSTPRTGTLTIAGQPFMVTEAAAPCNYVLSAANTTVASGGTTTPGSFTFSTATSGCSASAVSYASWISATTTAAPDGKSGTVNFTVPFNPNNVSRVGTIQFAGQTYTVTQTASACAFSLNAYGALFSKTGGSNAVLGSPSAIGCAAPSVGTDQPSIVTLSPLTGPVNNLYTLPFGVVPFNSAVTAVRLMTIGFGGQVYTIKQTSW